MLPFPPDSSPYRIIGLDPGTDTLGAATLDVHLGTGQVQLVEVRTFSGEQMARDYPWVRDIHGNLVARLYAHEENLFGYFTYLQPHCIISESPFMGKFAAAFKALTECLTAIRHAVMRYSPYMPLLLVDPPTVKMAVNVKGNADKDKVKRGLKDLIAAGLIINPYNVDIDNLDEHGVDAIVVAYTRADYLRRHF